MQYISDFLQKESCTEAIHGFSMVGYRILCAYSNWRKICVYIILSLVQIHDFFRNYREPYPIPGPRRPKRQTLIRFKKNKLDLTWAHSLLFWSGEDEALENGNSLPLKWRDGLKPAKNNHVRSTACRAHKWDWRTPLEERFSDRSILHGLSMFVPFFTWCSLDSLK